MLSLFSLSLHFHASQKTLSSAFTFLLRAYFVIGCYSSLPSSFHVYLNHFIISLVILNYFESFSSFIHRINIRFSCHFLLEGATFKPKLQTCHFIEKSCWEPLRVSITMFNYKCDYYCLSFKEDLSYRFDSTPVHYQAFCVTLSGFKNELSLSN